MRRELVGKPGDPSVPGRVGASVERAHRLEARPRAANAADGPLGPVRHGGPGARAVRDTVDAHDASAISVADAGGYYTATTVEGALEEAQARGALTGWTLSCTDAVDSAGPSWPVDQAHVFRVGQTYADVLRQMADTSIEYRAQAAGLRLDVYRKGTVTTPNAATFTIGSNLAELEEDQPK